MRKAAALFAFLLVLGLGGMFYAHTALIAAQDDVTLTKAASYGDASAADGLTVSVNAQLMNHLSWDSVYTFGQEGGMQTDFNFSSKQLSWNRPYHTELLSLNIASDFSGGTSGGNLLGESIGSRAFGNDFYTIEAILREVASRTKNGEKRTETVTFKDYYDYYPINASLLPSYVSYISDNRNGYFMHSEYDDEVLQKFNSYFQIPVPEDYQITVGITKDSAGNVVELSSAQNNPVWLNAISVDTDYGVIFALQTEGITDYSGVDGGFGIYLLPAATMRNDDGTELPVLDYNNLRTVYTLSESASVQKLFLSEDCSCLNLITIEDGVLRLTVIELATMTEKQMLPLIDDMGEYGCQTITYADGLLFVLLGNNRFAAAEHKDDNIYKLVLASVRDEKLLFEDLFAIGFYRWYEPIVSWNGERLAIVTPSQRFIPEYYEYQTGYSIDTCGFVLEVYDESGLTYKGIYESSLDVLAQTKNYNGYCHLIDIGGLSGAW